MKRRALMALFLGMAIAGCGGPKSVNVTPAPPPPIQPFLESIASSGQMGSEVDIIRENLEKMKATDPQKADGLLKDFETMRSTADPEQVKTQAKAMLSKL